MKAGRLTSFLTLCRLEVSKNPNTGAILRKWVDVREVRAERVKFIARAVTRGVEGFVEADAVFYVRDQHHVEDGWRVRERNGTVYDVVVEPNREQGYNLLKCTKVND